MKKKNLFKYFKTSEQIIRLAVMYYVRYPLSLRQVEDILHERGIEISHEAVRFWWRRFGDKFAKSIRKKRRNCYSNWQWHIDEVFVKIKGKRYYLWRAVDQEGEVLEAYVSKKRNKREALKFLKKLMKKYGNPHKIVTDRLASYRAALRDLSMVLKQEVGRYKNNRAENSHLVFRRRERAMKYFRKEESLQRFTSIQGAVYNHFNKERHYYT
ncbi:MAG: IS6 family transposase [Alphaproteobacteria bacterium]